MKLLRFAIEDTVVMVNPLHVERVTEHRAVTRDNPDPAFDWDSGVSHVDGWTRRVIAAITQPNRFVWFRVDPESCRVVIHGNEEVLVVPYPMSTVTVMWEQATT